MANNVALSLDILAKDKGAKRTLDGIAGSAKGVHTQMAKVAGAFAGGVLAAGTISYLKNSVAAAEESRKIAAITAQVVKTTGGAAKLTAAQVGDLAEKISLKTGVDDEAIQSAQNLLLTFTKVRNEVGKGNDIFTQASQIAVDMGVALKNGPEAGAIQLGKALNDPIKGVTALSRVGVSFTEQQKKQIRTLTESGRVLDAQKIILRELNTEFGGTAAASASASDKLKVSLGNLSETVGEKLLPYVDRFATKLNDDVVPAVSGFLEGMESGTGPGGEFADAMSSVGTALSDAWDVGKPFLTFIADHPKLFTEVALGAAGLAVAAKGLGALKGLPGVGGAAAKVAGKAGVVPVFVTNPGFGGGIDLPGGGGGKGNKLKNAAKSAGKWAGPIGAAASLGNWVGDTMFGEGSVWGPGGGDTREQKERKVREEAEKTRRTLEQQKDTTQAIASYMKTTGASAKQIADAVAGIKNKTVMVDIIGRPGGLLAGGMGASDNMNTSGRGGATTVDMYLDKEKIGRALLEWQATKARQGRRNLPP